MQNIKNNRKAGYTIIETMISISLFIVIVMTGMSALLNANLLHQKSRDMRSIMDNLSFIMEDMSTNLRTGYNYRCYSVDDTDIAATNISVPRSCESGGWGISFEQQNGVLDDDPDPAITDYHDEDQWAYYVRNNGIFRSSAVDGLNFMRLTPNEVSIDTENSYFSISGAESDDDLQPSVTIKLVGTVTSKGVVTPFSLKTSVSQRVLDR
jgi:type II secretory pathway pseudopilin PulG